MRRFVPAALAGCALAVVVLIWLLQRDGTASSAGGYDRPPVEAVVVTSRPSSATVHELGAGAPQPAAEGEDTSDPSAGSRGDRTKRNELRERIFAAYGQPPSGSTDDRVIPGKLDAAYVRKRVVQDITPMASDCYAEAFARDHELNGTLVLTFRIMGAPGVGGIVDSAEVDESSTVNDAKLLECIKEAMLSMVFEPPANGGTATVRYPFRMHPGEAGPAAASAE